MFAAAAQEQAPVRLQILVIGGEGSINNVKQRTAREPVVEVRDQNNRPVSGALVLFEAPRDGASGTFTGGSSALRVTTDAQGRAVGQGFRPNSVQGQMAIKVTASFAGGAETSVVIHMTNAGGGGASAGNAAKTGILHGKLIAVLVVAAGAAAAGAVAATHLGGGSANPTTTSPTTITAGGGTVGPHP